MRYVLTLLALLALCLPAFGQDADQVNRSPHCLVENLDECSGGTEAGRTVWVLDGETSIDCTTGGGSYQLECQRQSDYSWSPSGATGTGGYFDQLTGVLFPSTSTDEICNDASCTAWRVQDTGEAEFTQITSGLFYAEDNFRIHLDEVPTVGNQSFEIYNNANSVIFSVNEGGDIAVGSSSEDGILELWANSTPLDIVAPAALGAYWQLTLPLNDGNPGDYLTTDGSGVTSWVAPGNTHSGTVVWSGTSILESGTQFQFGDGTDATLTHTYAVLGTNSVVTWGDGTVDFSVPLTASSFTADPVSAPAYTLYDDDGAGAELADKQAGQLGANLTTTTEDSEDSDVWVSAMKGGTPTNVWYYTEANDDHLFTGAVRGSKDVQTITDGSCSPTMFGSIYIIDHATPGTDTTCTLPAAASGLNGCFYEFEGSTGNAIIDPNGSEVIVLDGVAESAGESIENTSAADGDSICLFSDGTQWFTVNKAGTWDGSVD